MGNLVVEVSLSLSSHPSSHHLQDCSPFFTAQPSFLTHTMTTLFTI